MVRFSLRIPDDLHEQIIASAQADRRSLNAQMLYLIEKGLGHDGRSAPEAVPPAAGRP